MVHLTNVAIQKTADGYDKGKGCKWLFSRVKAYLASRFGDDAVRGCLQAVNTVITRSLESVQVRQCQCLVLPFPPSSHPSNHFVGPKLADTAGHRLRAQQ